MAAPVNITPPSTSAEGYAYVGDTITLDQGTWENSPTSFTYGFQFLNMMPYSSLNPEFPSKGWIDLPGYEYTNNTAWPGGNSITLTSDLIVPNGFTISGYEEWPLGYPNALETGQQFSESDEPEPGNFIAGQAFSEGIVLPLRLVVVATNDDGSTIAYSDLFGENYSDPGEFASDFYANPFVNWAGVLPERKAPSFPEEDLPIVASYPVFYLEPFKQLQHQLLEDAEQDYLEEGELYGQGGGQFQPIWEDVDWGLPNTYTSATYTIQVSDDNSTWTDVDTNNEGNEISPLWPANDWYEEPLEEDPTADIDHFGEYEFTVFDPVRYITNVEDFSNWPYLDHDRLTQLAFSQIYGDRWWRYESPDWTNNEPEAPDYIPPETESAYFKHSGSSSWQNLTNAENIKIPVELARQETESEERMFFKDEFIRIFQVGELVNRYVRIKIELTNDSGSATGYTESFYMEPIAPGDDDRFDDYNPKTFLIPGEGVQFGKKNFFTDVAFSRSDYFGNIKENQLGGLVFNSEESNPILSPRAANLIHLGMPASSYQYQWQGSNDKVLWDNVEFLDPDAFSFDRSEPNWWEINPEDVFIPGYSDYGITAGNFQLKKKVKNKYLRLKITAENSEGSTVFYSNTLELKKNIVLIEDDPVWKFILYDYQGNALGELVDMNNVNLDIGINKNPTMSFDTTLESPLGKVLADGLNADEPLFFITGHRYNPYDELWDLKFSGTIFSLEERGSDRVPTIGVNAVGGHYQLTKLIANDAANNGRSEGGLKPTQETIYIYVADSGNDRIAVFNAESGSLVDQWGSLGTSDGQFDNPFGVDVLRNEFVYVADTDNNRIQKFDLDGTHLDTWTTAETSTDYFSYPIDVAADQLTGHIWIADRGNRRVIKMTEDGEFLLEIPYQTNCPMDNLRGISVDYEGNAYIADETPTGTNPNNQGVYKISPNGTIKVETSGIILSAQKKFVLDDLKQAYWVNQAGRLRRGPGTPKLTSKASTMVPSTDGQSVEIGPDRAVYFLQSGSGTGTVKKYNAANNLSKTIGSGSLNNAKGLALARYGAKDAIEIIADVLDFSNQENDVEIIKPPTSWNAGPKIFINPGSLGGYRSVASLLEELNENFEWTIDPEFDINSGKINLGTLQIEPVLGSNLFQDQSIVFEYGFGKHNVDDYTIRKSIENLANIINYPAAEQKPYNIQGRDIDLVDQIGVYEDVISGNLLDKNLRKNLVDLHLFYRTEPRGLIEITPARSDQTKADDRRVPIPLIDYNVGDIVGVGVQENDQYRFEPAEVRIYDIQIQIDSEGKETATLNLYPQ